jgi:hypothetical protein
MKCSSRPVFNERWAPDKSTNDRQESWKEILMRLSVHVSKLGSVFIEASKSFVFQRLPKNLRNI